MSEYEIEAEEVEETIAAIGQVGRSLRHPTIDSTAWLTDEQYAAGDWHRLSYEVQTFGLTQDSRIQDSNVERGDQSGFRFYTPILVEEPEVFVLPTRVARDRWGSPQKDRDGNIVILESEKKSYYDLLFTHLWEAYRAERKRQRVIGDFVFDDEMPLKYFSKADFEGLNDYQIDRALRSLTLRADIENSLRRRARKDARRSERLARRIKRNRYWVLTPMTLDALPQAPRRPFFMSPKWQLDEIYGILGARSVDFPDELVPYMFAGCRNDEQLIRFFRTDDGVSDPPVPMRRQARPGGNWGYYITRGAEDERGLTMRTKWEVGSRYLDAHQVYEGELSTQQRTGYFDRYSQWGFRQLGGPRVIEYPLKEFLERFPEELPREQWSDRAALTLIDRKVREGVLKEEQAEELAGRLRTYYEDWLDEEYDWWLPSEFHRFRQHFYNRLQWFGEDSASKADRIWSVMKFIVDVRGQPKVVDPENRVLDWDQFESMIYVSPVETRRDIVRLYNQWKMSRASNNVEAGGQIEDSDIKSFVRMDWGGPRNPGPARQFWRFMKLRQSADVNPGRAHQLLGRIWLNKRPHQVLDHYGALATKFGHKYVQFTKNLDIIRDLTTPAAMGLLPKWEKFHTDWILKLRGEPSEWYWLAQRDEFTTMDPYQVWRNERGIIVTGMLDEANERLMGAYAHVPQLRLNYDTCTNLRWFAYLMWYYQPVEAVRGQVLHKIEEAEENHLFDTPRIVVEETEGLPSVVVPDTRALNLNPSLGLPVPGPNLEMERMIWELRWRTFNWIRRRGWEKNYVNGGRAFTPQVFSGLQDRSGMPFRIGNPELSIELNREFWRQAWLNPVYDGLIGRAEAQDTEMWTTDDEHSFRKSSILGRRMNIWYAAGKEAAENTRLKKVEWVGEALFGFCGYEPEGANKIATMIVDSGSSWADVLSQAKADGKTEQELEVIEEVYLTFRDIALDVR